MLKKCNYRFVYHNRININFTNYICYCKIYIFLCGKQFRHFSWYPLYGYIGYIKKCKKMQIFL